MQVSVKLVVFWHDQEGRYFSYCPAIRCFFGKGKTVDTCVQIVRDEYLLWHLKGRKKYTNLQHYGWQITDNEVVPPNFTDKECVREAKRLYPGIVNEPQVIEIHVEVPQV